MLVCALIALAAGLVGSFLSGSDQKQFTTNLREIAARLTNARRLAIVTGVEQHVKLATEAPDADDVDDDARDEAAAAGPPDWLNPDMRLHYAATLDDSLEETAEVVVTFFPLGSSTGGVLQLSDRGDREAYVYVSPLTGKMVVERSLRDLEERIEERIEEDPP